MDATELTAYATVIALYICKTAPSDHLLLISSFLAQVSETITRVRLQDDLIKKSLLLDAPDLLNPLDL